ADVDVQQSALDVADDLVPPGFGLDELRVLVDVAQQPVLKRGLPEQVARLTAADIRRLVVRTNAVVVLVILLRLERLATVAVPALVARLVDVAGVVDPLQELADALP